MEDYYLQQLREKIRRLEYDKLSHEVLLKFIEESSEKGIEFRKELENAKSETLKFLNKIKDTIIKHTKLDSPEKLEDLPSAGVDGSNQVVGGKFGKFYIMLAAGISKFLDGPSKNCEIEFSDVKIVSYYDPTGSRVYSVAEDLMLELETKAIYHFVNKDAPRDQTSYLILDGPIIDPPRYPVGYTKSHNDYISYRAKAILSGINRDPPVIVLGYNKRVMGFLFKKHIESKVGESMKTTYSDFDVLSIIFLELLSKDRSIYYTKPIKNTEVDVAREYEKNGLTVYSSFSMFSPRSPVFRVDIATDETFSEQDISKLMNDAMLFLRASTLPGMKYPIQITTIHEKVSIRRGAAEVIYNEILTKAASTGEEMIRILTSFLVE